MTRLSRRLRQEAVLGEDMTPTRFAALASIEREGPLSQRELARLEQVAAPTMSRVVAALEAQDYIERTVLATDRRCVQLVVTPSGRDYLEAFRNRRDAYLAERLAGFTGKELEVLEAATPLLERLLRQEEL